MLTAIDLNDPQLTRAELHALRTIALRLNGYVTKAPLTPAAFEEEMTRVFGAECQGEGEGR